MSRAKSVLCGIVKEGKPSWSIGEQAVKKSKHDVDLSMSDGFLAERGGEGS
jgi:hypothetical protein